jgi:hypothetical protein
MLRHLLLLLFCGLVLFLGCVSINETDPNSTLPSNRPASWEGKTLGVPL